MNKDLTAMVNEKLPLGWSPERIAGYARRCGYTVSKKAIYKFIKSRCLEQHLFWKRNKKKSGRKRPHTSPTDTGKRLVEERPAVTTSGHWELDFLVSSLTGAVLMVMVDRWTRYAVIKRLERKTHRLVLDALYEINEKYTVSTITTDNDIVFTKWREMEALLPAFFYFCRPYHSWEKGLVENTNRWIRCFVPKRTDLSLVSDDDIRSIEEYLNDIPRQCLSYYTARELLVINSKVS
jgi:transposase, IS30 family